MTEAPKVPFIHIEIDRTDLPDMDGPMLDPDTGEQVRVHYGADAALHTVAYRGRDMVLSPVDGGEETVLKNCWEMGEDGEESPFRFRPLSVTFGGPTPPEA